MALTLRWLLWLWISAVVVGGLIWAPLSVGFAGRMGDAPQSSRIVYFHVPIAVASFIAFMAAAVWAVLYLWRRKATDDHASAAAVEVGMVFCVLATVTGAVWSEVQWGAFWNWDPRQTSIVIAILFYGAYLSLRGAIEDAPTRARLSAAYAALGLAVAPFLFFIMPRMASFSLHPKPAGAEMERSIGIVVVSGIFAMTALFFWMQSIRRRMLTLEAAMDEMEELA
ncbi:MAG: cytochrome c biogenesis protein CcsA [Acidobacteriota bacterium]